MVPSQLRVRVTRRPRYSCHGCESAVVVAPAPERPVDGGMPTEALIAHVVVSKFADLLPLYRQVQILERQGIKLDRSTLANWVGHVLVADAALRIDARHGAGSTQGVRRRYHGACARPPVGEGSGRGGCGATRSMTGLSAVPVIQWEDRKNQRPIGHLAEFRGVLQVAGYNGFEALADASADASVMLAFCWSHMRRYFYDEYVSTKSPLALRCWSGFGFARYMRSRPRSAVTPPNIGAPCARNEAVQLWRRCTTGFITKSRECRARPIWL